jgi:hypothetical protein
MDAKVLLSSLANHLIYAYQMDHQIHMVSFVQLPDSEGCGWAALLVFLKNLLSILLFNKSDRSLASVTKPPTFHHKA